MKLCKTLNLVWIINFSVLAQHLAWQRSYGGEHLDAASAIRVTHDGKLIVAGFTESFGSGKFDFYLLKIDENGDTIWTKTYGGAENDFALSIAPTLDGDYIITGLTYSFGNGGSDIYVIKVDSVGNEIWSRTFGSEMNDAGWSVIQINDGGFIITGDWGDTNNVHGNAFLLKLNEDGDSIWARIYERPQGNRAVSIAQLNDSGYVAVGTIRAGIGGLSGYVIRFNSEGDTLWSTIIPGGDGASFSEVKPTIDGGFVVIGTSYSIEPFIYLFKFSSSGSIQWYRAGILQATGESVHQTPDGGYVVCGSTYNPSEPSNAYVIKFTAAGDTIWKRIFGGSGNDGGTSIISLQQDEYVVAGRTTSFGAGNEDVYVFRVSSVTDLNEESNNLLEFSLYQNYPNPFNPGTTIEFTLDESMHIELSIYNILGEKIVTLLSGLYQTGKHSVNWNALDQPGGIYFYRLRTNSFTKTNKMILLR